MRAIQRENRDELEAILAHLDDCDLECDGMTFAISSLLIDADIQHQMMIGAAVQHGGATVFPHLWIELAPGVVVDYRLRMWLGDTENVPHGVFCPAEKGIVYRGSLHKVEVPSKAILSMLTDGKINDISLVGMF